MALPISVTYTFATATSAIPLSQLDANFTTVVNGVNGIGNGTNALSNVSITGGNLVVTTANATTGNFTTVNATTLNAATHRSDTTLTFQTNGTTTAMTVDTSQNVGIGTASPGSKLDVNGTITGRSALNAYSAGNSNLYVRYSGGINRIDSYNDPITATTPLQLNSSQYTFLVADTERMRIDSSGNVGIGTSSIENFGSTSRLLKVAATASSGYGALLINSGSKTIQILANSDGGVMTMGARSNDSIAFCTNDTERARIDTSGNLLVGRTGQQSTERLGVTFATGNQGINTVVAATTTQYHCAFTNPNGAVGSIYTTGTTTGFATSSDYRLKHDIQPMTAGLATITVLKPVTYKWNADDSDGEGFIAHELQEVIPHAVTGEKDAVDEDGKPIHQGVDYSKIVVHLVAACQEQQAQIEELKARVAALEAK